VSLSPQACSRRANSMVNGGIGCFATSTPMLPPPVPQFTVVDLDGFFLARVDLAWPGRLLAIEYDGQWHADRDQLTRDRRRLRALNAAGWQVYPVTRDDLRDIDRLARNILAVLVERPVVGP
jgi:Protein of unknown function (DUF559)